MFGPIGGIKKAISDYIQEEFIDVHHPGAPWELLSSHSTEYYILANYFKFKFTKPVPIKILIRVNDVRYYDLLLIAHWDKPDDYWGGGKWF